MITRLRSVALGVVDLERSTRFYTDVWGLQQVGADADGTRYLRATGCEHHVLSIRQGNTATLRGITLAVAGPAALDALCALARSTGVEVVSGPAALPAGGGGIGATLLGPEGLRVTVSCGVEALPPLAQDRSRPSNLTHVVINSADVPAQLRFFREVLGFRVSDSTHMMEFLRCGSDHHTVALARGTGLSLNHAAFQVADVDGLMQGAGRLIENDYPIEWGLGRHGPGNNIFTYFVDPDGFAVEYTTDMDQVVEEGYTPHDAQYWAAFPKRPCRWGVARRPSNRLMAAMAGELAGG